MPRFCRQLAILLLAKLLLSQTAFAQIRAVPVSPVPFLTRVVPPGPACLEWPVIQSENPLAAKSFQGLEVSLQIEPTGEIFKNELDVVVTYTCSPQLVETRHYSQPNPYLQHGNANPYLLHTSVQVVNTWHRIRNPWLSSHAPLPGDFVIRDARGREVNRIGESVLQSSMRAREHDDYVTVNPSLSAGATVRIAAAHNQQTDGWIGPGEYTLQFEMRHTALGLKEIHHTPVVRSEAVKFTFGPRSDNPPPPPEAADAEQDPRIAVTLEIAAKKGVPDEQASEGKLDLVLTFAGREKAGEVSVLHPLAYQESHPDVRGGFVVRDVNGKQVNLVPGPPGFFSGPRMEKDSFVTLRPGAFVRAQLQMDVARLTFSSDRLPAGEYTLEFAANERLFDLCSKDVTEKTFTAPVKFRLRDQPAK